MNGRTTRKCFVFLTAVMTLLTPVLAAADDHPATRDFDLEAFSELSRSFNAEQGSVRLVALLSASCGYCIKGYRYMRKLLEDVPDPRLKMLIAWEPMLSGDTRELSLKMAKKEEDPRLVYQAWDPARVTGDTYTEVMSSGDTRWEAGDSTAWDVYLLYDSDAVWADDRPTLPGYWQHQGAGTSDLILNYATLKSEIEKRLAALPPETAAAN